MHLRDVCLGDLVEKHHERAESVAVRADEDCLAARESGAQLVLEEVTHALAAVAERLACGHWYARAADRRVACVVDQLVQA